MLHLSTNVVKEVSMIYHWKLYSRLNYIAVCKLHGKLQHHFCVWCHKLIVSGALPQTRRANSSNSLRNPVGSHSSRCDVNVKKHISECISMHVFLHIETFSSQLILTSFFHRPKNHQNNLCIFFST